MFPASNHPICLRGRPHRRPLRRLRRRNRIGPRAFAPGVTRPVSGLNVAKLLLLRAATLDAAQMLACGFLDMVVAHATLSDEVERLSSELAGMAPLALLGMKKHLNRIANGTLDAAEFQRDVARADASHDLREGSLAWKEKRRPVFRGE